MSMVCFQEGQVTVGGLGTGPGAGNVAYSKGRGGPGTPGAGGPGQEDYAYEDRTGPRYGGGMYGEPGQVLSVLYW